MVETEALYVELSVGNLYAIQFRQIKKNNNNDSQYVNKCKDPQSFS